MKSKSKCKGKIKIKIRIKTKISFNRKFEHNLYEYSNEKFERYFMI